MIRRPTLPIAAVMLGVLLALLAFLQYRWLGQVSDGERQRMRVTLEARARDFAADFDREVGKAAAAFAGGPGSPMAEAWDRWRASASNPKMVRDVFVVDRSTPQLVLRRFDPSSRTLVPADWPGPLRAARDRWAAEFTVPARTVKPLDKGAVPIQGAALLQHLPARLFLDDLSDVPAIVVPNQPEVLRFDTAATPGRPAAVPAQPAGAGNPAATFTATRVLVQQSPSSRVIVLWLDLDEIRRVLLPALVRRYFAPDDVFDYQVSVLLRRDPTTVLFETDGPAGAASAKDRAPAQGDAVTPMFRVHPTDILARVPQPMQRDQVPGGQMTGYSINITRVGPATAPVPRAAVVTLADSSGGWLLRLVHRAGSLDAAVNRLRRRNLAISSTILGLLAVSLGFVLVSTRRAQRLAAQQVEFVASVSHELRTPLSVIRSAGENLADGVVDAPDQVRRYGALVAEEGRKLGAMVEQVMEYAGMQSNEPRWQKQPVDLRGVVEDAVAGARRLPEAHDATIELDVQSDLPPVEGDRAALVRAVQNLVENAIKYGGMPGGAAESHKAGGGAPECDKATWVGVRVRADAEAERKQSPIDEAMRRKSPAGRRPSVTVEIADRGPGIDAGERRRIFEPFVRGRAAAAARVPGNGLGLSIVRRIAEGHGGSVHVRSGPDGGATFGIRLPLSE